VLAEEVRKRTAGQPDAEDAKVTQKAQKEEKTKAKMKV
jgi:hypothetical protein